MPMRIAGQEETAYLNTSLCWYNPGHEQRGNFLVKLGDRTLIHIAICFSFCQLMSYHFLIFHFSFFLMFIMIHEAVFKKNNQRQKNSDSVL